MKKGVLIAIDGAKGLHYYDHDSVKLVKKLTENEYLFPGTYGIMILNLKMNLNCQNFGI